MSDDVNADLIGYETEFEDGTRWKVIGTDEVLGNNYVRLVRTNAAPGFAYTPNRIQTAAVVRRRKELELIKSGQVPLFEGPS